MNLADPAPKVEPAVADAADREETIQLATAAPTVEPAVATAAEAVERAQTIQDPRAFAPRNVQNATAQTLEQAQQSLSVEALRLMSPNGRLDFESYAAVIRGGVQKNFARKFLPFIFDERDFVAFGEVKYFVAVSGQLCMVYAEETSLKPYYALDLSEFIAIKEDPNKPDPKSFTVSPEPDTNKPRPTMITILLKDKVTKKLAYQFTIDTFKDKSLAKRFLDVVTVASSSAKKDVVDGVLVSKGKGKASK